MTAWLATLLVPGAWWFVGRRLAVQQQGVPSLAVHGILGFLGPAGLMCWRGRPFAEQLVAWAVGVIAWAGIFVIRDPRVFVAFGLVGATWGTALGLKTLKAIVPTVGPPASPAPRDAPADEHKSGSAGGTGFALELRCPTCGAALAVPVYHRMARCDFCASEHVVIGRTDILTVVIPDVIPNVGVLTQAVVRHLRDRRYLELYDTRVRPLTADSPFARDAEQGELPRLIATRPSPLVEAVEAEVGRAADEWAARIAPRVRVRAWHRFLSPYWHRLGTLYQAAFGRDRDGAKRIEFAVTTIEGSVSATAFPLPEMGKLSYLKALRPFLGAPEAACPALAADVGPEEIDRKVQQLSRRSSELTITPIAMHSTLVPEVVALVYRPWHVAVVDLDGDELAMLLDGGSARVEGQAPTQQLPTTAAEASGGEAPALAPSRCPDCGADLPFGPDSVAFLCRSCFHLVELRGTRWTSVPYLREEPAAGHRQVPFWRFPLRLRTASGTLITDIPHLTDGIDGAFDQIGDRPQTAQSFFVPAFRTRVSKAGVQLYRRLWPAVQGWPRELSPERFGPANPPERTVEVTLSATEARVFARVYLALSFTQRDLARAEVKGVRERFLSAELEGDAELVYLSLPEELLGPLDGLFGRARIMALANLEG
jgi:Flp pilus assembly pilin Flp